MSRRRAVVRATDSWAAGRSAVEVQLHGLRHRMGLAGQHVARVRLLRSPARSCGPSAPRPRPGRTRQVPHTPPLQAYGASARLRSTVSSTDSPSCTGQLPERPSRVAVTVAAAPGPVPASVRPWSRRVASGASVTWKISWWIRAPRHPERRAALARRPGPGRAARTGTSRRCRSTGSSAGSSPVSRSSSSRPGGQPACCSSRESDRHQLEAVREAVLEVGDLLQEHRRGGRSVAAYQAEAGAQAHVRAASPRSTAPG